MTIPTACTLVFLTGSFFPFPWKYRITKRVGGGSFGDIYLGVGANGEKVSLAIVLGRHVHLHGEADSGEFIGRLIDFMLLPNEICVDQLSNYSAEIVNISNDVITD